MQIRMLVSVSRDDFNARIGQEIEVDTKLGHELIQNEQAEPVNAIKVPRAKQAPKNSEVIDVNR